MNKNKFINKSFFLLVVFVLIFIRFFYLDADPSFFKRVGDIADEGYWTHNARTAVLFDNWTTDDQVQSLFLSPLYAFLVYSSFKIGGVSLYSARMVSVFFSLLTLFFLYLFIKTELHKMAAYSAVIMLGLNPWFLIYNKMALVETTLTFFLLMSLLCWYFQERSRWYSLGSGVFFSLAILTKITAIYFFPVFALLIIFDKMRNRFNLQQLLIYASSALVLLSAYFYFIFVPNWLKYKKYFFGLMLFDHKNVWEILASPFRLLSNNFFGDISIYILFILFLIYGVVTFFQKPFRDTLLNLHYMEILALSWIGGGITGLFFSNMHDRRFFIFIIPLIILTLFVLMKYKGFSIKNISPEVYRRVVNKPWTSLLFSLYLSFPIISALYFFVEVYFHFNYSNDLVNFSAVVFYLSSAILFNFWLVSKAKQDPEQARSLFSKLIIAALMLTLLLPALTAWRPLLRNVLIAVDGLAYEPLFFAITTILFLFLLFFLGLFFLGNKELGFSFTRRICSVYLYLNIIFIGVLFLFPSFTVRDASRDIGLYVPSGEIMVGSFANLLAIENEALPFLYAPYDKDYAFMNNETVRRQAFLLISTKYDGRMNDLKEELSKYNYDDNQVTFIREFDLYRYPNNIYKNKIRLYKIGIS